MRPYGLLSQQIFVFLCLGKSVFGTYSKPGRTALGQHANQIIHIGQAVLFYNGSVEYFQDIAFNYPTLAAAYEAAALGGLNKL
jgi:NAD(P) transhydrogenase